MRVERVLEPGEQADAIRQAGQVVMVRAKGQLAFGSLAAEQLGEGRREHPQQRQVVLGPVRELMQPVEPETADRVTVNDDWQLQDRTQPRLLKELAVEFPKS